MPGGTHATSGGADTDRAGPDPASAGPVHEEADGAVHEFVRGAAGPVGMVVTAVGYRSEGLRPSLHRGLPSPYLTLIFALDGPVTWGYLPGPAGSAGADSGGACSGEVGSGAAAPDAACGPDAVSEDIVLSGLHQSPAYVLQPERQAGIQLALHPLAARALLGLPAGELTADLIGSGGDVLGAGAAHIHEQMCEQTGWDERFATLRAYLRRRLAATEDTASVRPEVAEAWAWLARHRGAAPVEDLAAHVALSQRRLTTLFRAETGVSPKQAARLMRFHHARGRLVRAATRGNAPLDLAGIAAASGYYDHSHLVRDFRQYTGVSPTGWLAEECRNIQASRLAHGEESAT